MSELEALRRQVEDLATQIKILDTTESQSTHDINTAWIVRSPLEPTLQVAASVRASH